MSSVDSSLKTKSWEVAYQRIKEAILTMKYSPGEQLTEVALAETFKVGRTPVREALVKLEQDGLIVTDENSRKHVYVLTIGEAQNIFDLKICIESYVARRAAEKIDEEGAARLQKCVDAMSDFGEAGFDNIHENLQQIDAWLDLDNSFHDVLFDLAGNPRAEQIVGNLNLQWHWIRMGLLAIEGRMERSVQEHVNIARAVCDGKADEAARLMDDHLTNLRHTLIHLMHVFHYPS